MTMGSQDNDILGFDFSMEYQYSPAPEPGPSRVSQYHQVFNITPQSEPESEEEIEHDEGTYQDEETDIWVQPDTAPEDKDGNEVLDDNDNIHAACFEDPRVIWREDAHQLNVEQELDDLGSSILSRAAKDNIKVMAFKIRNQLTRIDEYEDDPGQPAQDKQTVCYGQVQSYLYVTLPAEPRLKTNSDSMAILVLVTLCKMNGKDVSVEPVWYKDMETVRAFDIGTIDCVIGRIKVGDRWGIVDQSYGSSHAVMHGLWEPEYESEDAND
jgi:hypothetical protein